MDEKYWKISLAVFVDKKFVVHYNIYLTAKRGFSMTTHMAKKGESERKWHLVDAKGKTLGRLASRIAILLRGKHKPTFTPHVDMGDFVVVVNAEKVALTGKNGRKNFTSIIRGTPAGSNRLAPKN